MLLHSLWVSAELYEPLRNTHRFWRPGSLKEASAARSKEEEEVMILTQRS